MIRRNPSSAHRVVVGALVALALTAAACSNNTSSAPTTTSTPGGTSATTTSTAKSSGLATAEAALAPITTKSSPFPDTQKLTKLPPAGFTIAYLECGAPVCAGFATDLQAPVKALGGKLSIISAGLFPTTVQAAANEALAEKPAAVLVAGTTLSEFGTTLKSLESAGIPVFGIGVTGGKAYGLTAVSGGLAGDILAGRLMADWVLVHVGTKANVVFFNTPELSFSPFAWAAFDAQLKTICPTCTAAEAPLSILTFGSSAPANVVSYLRSHPSVNTTVFASEEGATGLPAALQAAGMTHITTFGFAPTAANLANIEAGTLTAGLGVDLDTEVWQICDIIAKTLTHQSVQASEDSGVVEILDKANVTAADAKNGWTAFPNDAQRFGALWP